MARKKKIVQFTIGVTLGLILNMWWNSNLFSYCEIESLSAYEQPEVNDPPSNDSLLLVGVMTAQKYTETRAKTVYKTWGSRVPGKVLFFSSENSKSRTIPLIALPGVDDSYPPQKKSFMMIKYMHDNYLNSYEWFLRSDDDVYIKTNKLEAFLRSIDSRKPWFIGQTGRGNSEEFGQLSLEDDQNFCMGGPGVIMSRETLRLMAPHIEECLGNLYTNHEDVELGRCVRRFAGISCTWSYEMQVIFYHNQSGNAAFSGNLNQKEVYQAITLHPVKKTNYMDRLHKYVKAIEIQELRHETIQLHRDIATAMSYMGIDLKNLQNALIAQDVPLFPDRPGSKGYLGDPEILGVSLKLNRFQPNGSNNVLDWDFISKSLYTYRDLNPRHRLGSSLKEGVQTVVREVMENINRFSKQRGRIIDFKEILYGYCRMDALHGVDYILDMSLTYKKYRGHKMTVPVRKHAYIQQTFSGIYIREVNYSQTSMSRPIDLVLANFKKNIPLIFKDSNHDVSSKNIVFILPLSSRFQTFLRFMEIFERVCLKENKNTRIQIVLYKTPHDMSEFENSFNLIIEFRKKYGNYLINYTLVEEEFSRGVALQNGVSSVSNEDEILFFIDVDMVFTKSVLQRIRYNTVRSKSIYFPIVYSLYNPKITEQQENIQHFFNNPREFVDDRNGFWRQFGFGIASLYKSDFVSLGGFKTSIVGWGMEDVDFFDEAVKSSLKIVRCIDPELVHWYHPIHCDEFLGRSQMDMCLGSKASIFGSLNDTQRIIMKHYDELVPNSKEKNR